MLHHAAYQVALVGKLDLGERLRQLVPLLEGADALEPLLQQNGGLLGVGHVEHKDEAVGVLEVAATHVRVVVITLFC